MNIRIPVLAVVTHLFLASGAFAAAELSVEQGNFNFGSVAQGRKVQHSFVIKNTGDAPLQIRQLKASCGCTAATPSSTTIAPGKSGEIKVTFDSTNFSGKVTKSVAMDTNAGKTPNYTFTLDGSVVEELQLVPRTVSLGAIKIGAPKQMVIAATNNGPNTIRLLSVTSTSPQIKAVIRKGEIKPGGSGALEVTVTPQTDARILSGYLHLTTEGAQKRELTIPVYASPVK